MIKSKLLCALCVISPGAVGVAAAQDQGAATNFIQWHPDAVLFVSLENNPAVQFAILAGDPEKPGTYVIRLRIPPGFTFTPHYHDQDRHVTVISGPWAFGTGSSGHCADTIPMPAGSYVFHPKGAIHFDGACDNEPVEIQIIGVGPVRTFRDGIQSGS